MNIYLLNVTNAGEPSGIPATAMAILRIRVRNRNMPKPLPKALLTGEWLSELGFVPRALLIAISEPGRITFQLQDGIKKCKDLRLVCQGQMEMIQVRETVGYGKLYPYITVPVSCLRNAGFTFGDALLVSCEHDIIILEKLNLEALGL